MADPRNIYKYSLFLPIIVPLLFAPVLYFGLQSLGERLGLVVIIIVYSGIIGGIPYFLLGVLMAIWMRGKSEVQIRNALLLSPLIMAGLTAIFLLVLRFVPSDNLEVLHSLGGFFGILGVLALFIAIFGYAYVGIAFGLVRVARGQAFVSLPK